MLQKQRYFLRLDDEKEDQGGSKQHGKHYKNTMLGWKYVGSPNKTRDLDNESPNFHGKQTSFSFHAFIGTYHTIFTCILLS